MTTPRHGSDVTGEWLEQILSQYEARSTPGVTVTVTSFTVTPATKPGENFGSEAEKIKVEAEVRNGKDGSQSTTPAIYHLFAKFLTGTSAEQEFMKVSKLHLRELLAYSDVIAELNEFQAKKANDKYRIQIPKFVYGICTDDDYVLVMEDISPAGYVMMDKVSGLDLPHTLMAVDGLARLHAVSYAFSQTHDFFRKYPAFNDNFNFFNTFFKSTANLILDAVTEAAEKGVFEDENLLPKLKQNKDSILLKLSNALTIGNDAKLACLAHGDPWTNNLMFVNKDSKPQSMMFVDWGLTNWRNPVLDLQYFIHISTTASLRRNNLEEMLRRYHSTFTSATKDLGTPVEGWEFEDFMVEWRRTRTFGTTTGLVAAMMTLSNAAKKLEKGKRPSTDSFSTKIGTRMMRVMAPMIMTAFTSPWLEFFPNVIFAGAFKPMSQEVISGNNDQLQACVSAIMEEADYDGVLDA